MKLKTNFRHLHGSIRVPGDKSISHRVPLSLEVWLGETTRFMIFCEEKTFFRPCSFRDTLVEIERIKMVITIFKV